MSGRDRGLAWSAGASLCVNDQAIQQQCTAPDAPRLAPLKRTIQAGGPSRTAGAHSPGPRDATGIVGKEQLGCPAARQLLVGDGRLQAVLSGHLPWNARRQGTPPGPRGRPDPAMTEARPKSHSPASGGIPTCAQRPALASAVRTSAGLCADDEGFLPRVAGTLHRQQEVLRASVLAHDLALTLNPLTAKV